MPRAKKHEEHENHERWLVSYADFITLLFAFFVVMYSVSSVNEGKYRVLSDSLLTAFHSAPKSLEPLQVGKPSKSTMISDISIVASPNILTSPGKGMPMVSRGENNENNVPENEAETEAETEAAGDAALEKIAKDIETAMASLIDIGLIKVRRNDLWLEIEIKNSILFTEGSAKLKSDVIAVLNTLANIFRVFPNSIRVEGFTDNVEKSDNIYPTNWELSSARSSSIVRLFEIGGVLPERLSAVGYGQNRPVADNSTALGRQKNRRVVIVVLANNNVTGTVKTKKTEHIKEIKLSVSDLKKSGLIEEPLVLESARKSDADLMLKYENIEINFGEQNMLLVKPLISSPIKLFNPIQLPSKEIQDETRR